MNKIYAKPMYNGQVKTSNQWNITITKLRHKTPNMIYIWFELNLFT